MTRDEVIGGLDRLGACGASLSWLRSQPAEATAEELWGACEAPRWLDWLVERLGLDTHAYREALAPAWRAYDEATAPARRAYDEATAAAERAYADAIRDAVPWARVAAKLEER